MKKFQIIFLFSFFLTLVGCQNSPHKTTISDTTKSEKISVVTSFYPLAFITKQIVGEKGEIVNLSGSTDIHKYRPSPQDIIKLNKADLVVIQGSGLEPWAEDILPILKQKNKHILEINHNLSLQKMEKPKHHDEKHEEHHHEGFDPHTWLDPVLAQNIVDIITQSLKNIDPKNKTYYRNNAENIKQQFKALDTAYQKTLSSCERNEIITSHDAFGYLARRYGFKAYSIAGLSTHDEPSAHTLAELKNEAKEGITHILTEQNNITRFAETLSDETGLQMLPLNTLGRGTLDLEKDFFDIMNDNLQTLKTALGCQSSK
ncbi:zinc ABC transporter substrate-binding protein [Candidatus Gracilibacteria bacterium]|nr:zinc ABC transporter substrate-binding protein [Candidatus Gracilibacteria bacterium]